MQSRNFHEDYPRTEHRFVGDQLVTETRTILDLARGAAARVWDFGLRSGGLDPYVAYESEVMAHACGVGPQEVELP